jgi:riboflavin synthase
MGTDTVLGKAAEAVAELPTGLLAHIKRTMYGGVLGISNVKAPMQNLIQPVVMGLPEFGNVYGAEVAARSLMSSAKNFFAEGGSMAKDAAMDRLGMVGKNPRPGNTQSMSAADAARLGRQQLRDQANNASYMLAGSRDSELRALLQGELKDQGFAAKAADKLTEASMMLFNASERFSRTWAIGLADTIFADLQAGRKSAQDVVRNLKGSYGDSIIRAMEAGNDEGAKELLRRYTLGRVVLNYDKASQSAFVREMGPMFSAFTRWPTESLARANYSLRTGGVRGAVKDTSAHVPVLAALLLAEQVLSDTSYYQEDTKNLGQRAVSRDPAFKNDPRLNQMFGVRGPAGMSMLTAGVDTATSFAGGVGLVPGNQQQSRHMPPFVQLALEAGSGAVGVATSEEGTAQHNAAMKQLRRAADLGAKLTVPGISFAELAVKTMPNLRGDDAVVTEGVGGQAFGKLFQGE